MSTAAVPEWWTWAPDVLAYADKHGIRKYLDEFLARTRRLFATARSLEVFTEPDMEDPNLTFLVFEVHVPERDVPDYRTAHRAWFDDHRAIDPGPYSAALVLSLRLDPA